jgi:integrase
LPDALKHPARFLAEVERRRNSTPTIYPAGSIGDLITRYRASDEFKRLSEGTQSNYEVHMRRFEAHDTWGMVAVRDLAPITVQTARDAMKETAVDGKPDAVGRPHYLGLGDSAGPRQIQSIRQGERLFDIPDRGHVPWPSWVIDHVGTHAWPDLVRMMRLGVMTCQRGSDLIRMGPEHRDRNGLWCRPLKTRKRRRSFHIPLAAADALEIDRWAETPVTFTNSRWLKPIDRFREDFYLYSPKGAQYTADGLRARWGRWLAETSEGRELCRRWKEWVAAQVKKYDWDIEPDDADHPTIHGLRGTGILARAEQGYEVDQIANDIGMSRQNVEHYMRFKDQMQVAAQGQKRLRLVAKQD